MTEEQKVKVREFNNQIFNGKTKSKSRINENS